MCPIFFKFSFLTIYTYGVLTAIGVFAGIFVAIKECQRLKKDPNVILDMYFYGIIFAFIGARLLYVLVFWDDYKNNPINIIKIWEGGLVFYGCVIFGFLFTVIFVKLKKLLFWQTLDIVALSVAIGQSFGRIGCFSAGCCYGAPTSMPWAVYFTDMHSIAPLNIPLHPTQLYESFLTFLIFAYLFFYLRHRKKFDGQIASLYLILYGIVRFIVEIFRDDLRGIFFNLLSTSQIISLVVVMIMFFIYFHLKKQCQK